MTEHYTHTVNGRVYDSRDLLIEGTAIRPESLTHYKRIVRIAYGNLRGVKFQRHAPCDCGAPFGPHAATCSGIEAPR
jgi:hypothetical protein